MDYEQDDNQNESMMQRIKESPRTVSALIIILIVAAAIYAFSGNTNKQTAQNDSLLTPTSVAPEVSPIAEVSPTPISSFAPTQPATSPSATPAPKAPVASMMTPISASDLASQVKALPAGERTAIAYVEKAQRGDSLTVLARRATTRWLNENSSGYAVSNEHRIYIEDYIKDHLQRHPVRIGQTEAVSFDLIRDAVASAGQLNNNQLQHLSKYVGHVHF